MKAALTTRAAAEPRRTAHHMPTRGRRRTVSAAPTSARLARILTRLASTNAVGASCRTVHVDVALSAVTSTPSERLWARATPAAASATSDHTRLESKADGC